MMRELSSLWRQPDFNGIRNTVLAAVFIVLTGNFALFKRLLALYPLHSSHALFLVSLSIFFVLASALFLLIICQGRATRWLLAFFLIAAALAAYFMDSFGVIIDPVMLDNVLQTDKQEVKGLLTTGLLLRTCLLGVLPAWLVFKYTPSRVAFSRDWHVRKKLMLWLIVAIALVVAPFAPSYKNFIREHRVTRFYANPTYFSTSLVKYIVQKISTPRIANLQKTAEDAVRIGQSARPSLIIMVVGETARADRFSLNGYARETNPLLAKQHVISFGHVTSCGTSTGVSVPCMFSALGRKNYKKDQALSQENALDVLSKHGVQVLWRDNNSDSKGVATRVKYEDFISPTLNPICEGECRDIGMLSGLDSYITARKGKDILIVLHQMGNHGPEYYRRYPKAFEKFKPMCMTGELRNCSKAEVDNSYDNAILYTDYFLSNIIDFLKKHDDDHETAMFYVSDHGESLGENGVYLHAAPYNIAPKEQTHVPAVLWLGKHFGNNVGQIKPYKDYALSHDDLFCTLLIAYQLQTKMCAAKQSWLMQNLDGKHDDKTTLPH